MLDVIKKRRSIRNYTDQEVSEGKLNEILKAAMFAPTARNKREWEFIVVRDQNLRDKLAMTKRHSVFINQAPVVLAICSKEDWDYWVEDLAIAGENIHLEAVNQGLGSCFIQIRGSKRDDGSDAESYVKDLLNISDHVRVLCLMPIGYQAKPRSEHKEEEFDESKIHYDQY